MRDRAETILVTPELARQWLLNWNTFRHQRPLYEDHINGLCRIMREGRFYRGRPIIVTERGPDQLRTLVDGQHRLSAIERTGIAQLMVVVFTECDSDEEIAQVFARCTERTRTLEQRVKALNRDDAELSPKLVAQIGRAGLLLMEMQTGTLSSADRGKLEYERTSAEYRYALALQWKEPALAFFDAVKDARPEDAAHFRLKEVLAVGLATFGRSPAKERARAFWQEVSTDSLLQNGEPPREAIMFLRNKARKGAGALYVAHGLALCWNRWWQSPGKLMGAVQVHSPDAAITLRGTPFMNGTDGVKKNVTGRDVGRPKSALTDSSTDLFPKLL